MEHRHFKDKDALSHVIEARVKGKIASDESHGMETPVQTAGIQAAKETATIYLLFWIVLQVMTKGDHHNLQNNPKKKQQQSIYFFGLFCKL